jgi:DNA-binding HxlR family transcriptional regulator
MRERNYRQSCSVARAADVIGDRWTLLIIRDLLIAPRRFGELERRMKGMGSNLLVRRLRMLGEAGLVGRGPLYTLTPKGRALEPVILGLARWGLHCLADGEDDAVTHFPDRDLLALKALFEPSCAPRKSMLAHFRTDEWEAWVAVGQSGLHFGLGTPAVPADIIFPCLIGDLRGGAMTVGPECPKSRSKAAAAFLASFPHVPAVAE